MWLRDRVKRSRGLVNVVEHSTYLTSVNHQSCINANRLTGVEYLFSLSFRFDVRKFSGVRIPEKKFFGRPYSTPSWLSNFECTIITADNNSLSRLECIKIS